MLSLAERCAVLVALVLPALAQAADISVTGAGGFSAGEEQRSHGISAFGATIGFSYAGRHRLQLDYLFNNVHGTPEDRHFITGSYLIQGSVGRARPFLQIGAGVIHQRFATPPFVPVRVVTDTSSAAVFGAGATIDVGKSMFMRPQLRLYGHVGPTITLLPTLGFGWRF